MRPTTRRDRPARSPSTRLATWALRSAASPGLSTPVGHGTVAATPGRPTMSKPKSVLVLAVIVTLLAGLASSATPADPIRIAYVDPLSGPFAATGENGLNQFKYATDAGQKHNERNAGNRVLYLNYSAVDPALTNEKCHYWHFRFDAHADMKMAALTDVIATNKGIKKMYIIGQDYSFGKAVAEAAVAMLGKKRPDITIVGNELHPIGKVKDFSPYVQKIVAAGADAVITGNLGADMIALAKAANDGGLKVPFYTYYAASDGVTAAIGAAGIDRIRLVHESHPGNPNAPKALSDYIIGYRKLPPQNDVNQPRIHTGLNMLAQAIKRAGTTDVDKVAAALEGAEFTNLSGDQVVMRREDHQLQMPIYISVHTNKNIKHDLDASGFGLSLESKVDRDKATQPSTCKMQRPS